MKPIRSNGNMAWYAMLLFFGAMMVFILVMSLRGLPGNPTVAELNTSRWAFDGPLELSPERGRFALLYSIVEDHSLIFSVPVARLAVPDLAINDSGQYVSLFAPAISFLVVPGYVAGKLLGASQAGAYAMISLFALLNVFLIAVIARRLGAGRYSAVFGGMAFLFATPAFAYGVDLYQHHVSVFLLLLSLWMLVSFRNMWSFAVVWFACALSVVVDNPNLFLMFPIGIFSLVRLFESVREKGSIRWGRFALGLLTFSGFVLPLAFFGWYNHAAYGNPLQLPGTLESVSEIGSDGKPKTESTYQREVLTEKQLASLEEDGEEGKAAVGFFKTRNLYNGFLVHFLSSDRGMLWFSPIMILGIAGLAVLYRYSQPFAALFIAVIGVNVLLYSMWGDPWGGWAFGSRYLIPTYALLAVGIAIAFSEWRRKWWFLIPLVLFFAYSAGVNTLGALTANTNPPKIQVLALEQQTGHEEKYTFLRNWEFLHSKYGSPIGSKSFVYQTWMKHHLSAPEYFALVYGVVLVSATLAGGLAWREGRKAVTDMKKIV
jgi:hypothetical protein